MKLCYIWVDKFRNFDNFGFNLSSDYKFNYDLKTNTITKKEFQPIPENFFGDRINDVVGIIGKNGTGKSNAVELICKILKGAKTTLQTDFFLIIEDNSNLNCYYSFANREPPETNLKIILQEYEGSVSSLKVVYFSNVFDERRHDFDKEVSDISINKLYSKRPLFRENQPSTFEKQVRLINSKIFHTLDIDLPKHVLITSKVWSGTNLNLNHLRSDDIIINLRRTFRNRLREIIPSNKFIPLLRFGYFFDFATNLLRRSQFSQNDTVRNIETSLRNYIPDIINLKTDEISERLIIFLESIIQSISVESISFLFRREDDIAPTQMYETISEQIKFLKEIKTRLEGTKIEYNVEGSRNKNLEYFVFDYRDKVTVYFINEYTTLFGQSNLFEINWIGISSGHKAYLNLFASLYQELRYTRQNNLLLCIDEGDLYLHPLWQIEFFDKLIKVVPKIYGGTVQFILTSHSPFLLSDIPNQNLTILDRSIKGFSIDGIDLNTKTFGGNLYDLYSEPFFLGSKRTSDFASGKIKTLIDIVESNRQFSDEEKSQLLILANLIGDEIIQFRVKKALSND